MNNLSLIPLSNEENALLFGELEPVDIKRRYKIHNDGSHYVGTMCLPYSPRGSSIKGIKSNKVKFFESLYAAANKQELEGVKFTEYLRKKLLEAYPETNNVDGFIEEHTTRLRINSFKRKKRLKRKAYLNPWNYFVTFTYDDKKQSAESFRKKLRRCLSNLHTKHGWRYMGVWEKGSDTDRLHFHALVYVPEGEMIGKIEEITDYSTRQHKMQTIHRNTHFYKRFGRNDFEPLSELGLHQGRSVDYLVKYIDKSGERIVYSRGVPMDFCKELGSDDIMAEIPAYVPKYVLFDDVIEYSRDVWHFEPLQLSFADVKPQRKRRYIS